MPPPNRFEFDTDYVERLAAGDADVERHFTRYFSDILTMKLRARLRSPALVEDARQETFLRVLATLREKGGLESAGSLGAFVNAVCNNVLFETYRAETKRRRHTSDDDLERVEPGPSAESSLATADDRVRVRRALRSLPDKDQTVLRALFFEDRDKDEICRSLGVERGHLRVLLHRAKARFRQALDADAPGDAAGAAPGDVTPRRPRALER